MTIIVCTRELMVSDTQTTDSHGEKIFTDKIFRSYDQTIFGVAGDADGADRYINWEEGGRKGRPPSVKKIDVLLLKQDGKIMTRFSNQRETEVYGEYYAIGIGSPIALALLKQGVDPIEVINEVCRLNAYCGIDERGPQVVKR